MHQILDIHCLTLTLILAEEEEAALAAVSKVAHCDVCCVSNFGSCFFWIVVERILWSVRIKNLWGCP
jgi:hypothetical protein